ncbi:MAG TPA: hypothetical protein VLF59_04210 [Candidatus Saccharimonadales bacterium]|nr:hypothetical protein [Candidatus Saccharimonadales bacterium]
MILMLHIIAALASLIIATITAAAPTRVRLRSVYGLSTLTLASGTYIVVSTGAPVVSSCLSGLLFLGAIAATVAVSRHRLAKAAVPIRR